MEYLRVKPLVAALIVVSLVGCASASMPRNSDGTWQRTSYADNRPEPTKQSNQTAPANPILVKGLITFLSIFVHATNESVLNQAYFPNAANNDYNVVHSANELSGANREYRGRIVDMWRAK